MEEIWKDISGYGDNYKISNFGRVKSSYRQKRILKQPLNTYGYPFVNLSFKGVHKSIPIHTLVANYFLIKPSGKTEVNHKNGIKTDNNVLNLEWCTSSENSIHSFENGLQVSSKGEDRPLSKLKKYQVLLMRDMANNGLRGVELTKLFNVSASTVSSVINRRSWKHIT